ncbi:MAG: GMC family oxidoreductase N-terminal domain-containing protein, partial [Methanobrevibacter sp.]|nr:GMC family oxidoreductase N-terminal domain-containing protein [Candidatus Methanoflexus mossambicus]
SDKDLDLLKTSCVGGSTTVAAGNGVRVLEDELNEKGIAISKEFDEIEELLQIHEMDDSHIGKGTQKFIEIANKLNLNPIKMPKFIKEESCIPCGKCAFGCPQDAKWTSKDFIKIAIENGAKLLDNTEVIEIATEKDIVKGVYISNKSDNNNKNIKFIESDLVILSAGAVNSAILLQKSGIKEAGKKFFMDPFVTIGGILKGIGFNKEVQMNALVESKSQNFILAPHYAQGIANELKLKLKEQESEQELKEELSDEDILSIMVKVPDDSYGEIVDGKVIKTNSIKDIKYIAEGSAVAGSILVEAGVNPNSIVSTHLRGAHPGGTAAIGELVDNNLETKIKGLFVSDASVLPQSPGAPPILTILALSKRLSKYIIANK